LNANAGADAFIWNAGADALIALEAGGGPGGGGGGAPLPSSFFGASLMASLFRARGDDAARSAGRSARAVVNVEAGSDGGRTEARRDRAGGGNLDRPRAPPPRTECAGVGAARDAAQRATPRARVRRVRELPREQPRDLARRLEKSA
jgi:hypothetical protein